MKLLLAAVKGPGTDVVAETAGHLAALLGAEVHTLHVPEDGVAAKLVAAAADPDVVALAVGLGPHGVDGHTVTGLVTAIAKPIMTVPAFTAARPWVAPQISRVLVPLDGTAEEADALRTTVDLFVNCGAGVVAVHALDPTETPFWDRPSRDQEEWADEFRARFCPQPDVRLDVRIGSRARQVLDVAEDEAADLIVLGWSRRLEGGHGRVVREVLASSRIPVLLLPVERPPSCG